MLIIGKDKYTHEAQMVQQINKTHVNKKRPQRNQGKQQNH